MKAQIVDIGPFPRLVIEDRSGNVHEIELADETANELDRLPCEQCPVAMYRGAL